ncbi:hypothetical protein JXO52_10600 [bacterium]|nr:hypothetical protein [bacterium]
MKIRDALLLCLLAAVPDVTAQKKQPFANPGFRVGAGYIRNTDFFIYAEGSVEKIPGTSGGPLLIAEYGLEPTMEIRLGYSCALSVAWFNAPDFDLDIATEIEHFSNVRYLMAFIEPHLVYRIHPHAVFSLGFMFALARNTHVHEELEYNWDSWEYEQKRITEAKNNPIGGASAVLTLEITKRIECCLAYRLYVGLVTAGEYDVIIDGTNVGSPGGGTEYGKMISADIRYRL